MQQLYTKPSGPSTTDPQVEIVGPPINLEAEQGVLGALLVWNDAIDDISFLGIEHFFDPLHQAIFGAISRTIRAGRLASPMTLAKSFANDEPVGNVPVPTYLGSLGTKAATRRELKNYAQTIVDLALRRWLIIAGEDLAVSAREASAEVSPQSLIEETEQRLFSLAERNAPETSTLLTFAQALNQAVEGVGNAYKNERSGLRTGLIKLDEKIGGGLQPTDLVILAGRPSMGKTALATNIAFHAALKEKTPVGFFSLEMSAEQLALRVLSEQVGVASNKLRSGQVTENDVKRTVSKALELADVPLFTDELGGATIAQVVARARRMKRKHGVGLIVIDYLQLMQASKRRENRVQDITEITTGLKALAKELRVPILALSQLSRETEKRENKRPQLSDLRESGSIEQDADMVLFVYREEYYLERQQPSETDFAKHQEWQTKLGASSGKAEVIIGKQRHGETGTVMLAFSGEMTRFSDLAHVYGGRA